MPLCITPLLSSPCLIWQVVCSYAYACRLFCGSLADDPAEAGACLLVLSAVLSGEQLYGPQGAGARG